MLLSKALDLLLLNINNGKTGCAEHMLLLDETLTVIAPWRNEAYFHPDL